MIQTDRYFIKANIIYYFLIEELFTITYEGEQYSIVAGYPVNGPIKVGQKFYLTTDDENILLTVKELELSDGSHPKSVNEYDNVAVWVDNYIKDYVESGDKLYLYEEWKILKEKEKIYVYLYYMG